MFNLSFKNWKLFAGSILFLALALALWPLISLAAEVPEVNALQALVDLITNWKALTPLGIGSAVIVIVVQLLKQFFPSSNVVRLVVVVLGVAYGVLTSLLNGMGIIEALVLGIITSGGAVAIYEAVKPLLPKK